MADEIKDLTDSIKQLVTQLTVKYSDEGADKVTANLNRYQRELAETNDTYKRFEIRTAAAREAVGGIKRALDGAINAVDGFGRSFGAANMSAESALKILRDTNTQIIQVSAQYARYGMSIKSFTETVEGMRTKFKLSYGESTKLLSQIENMFNFQRPQTFVTNGLDKVMKAFANNTEAAEGFLKTLESITATRPELEALVAEGNMAAAQASAEALLAAGSISIKEYKELQKGFSSMGRVGTAEGAEVDRLNERFMAEKTVQKSYEDGLKATGESLETMRKTIGLTNENLERLSKTISGIVQGGTITSTLMSAVSGVADFVVTTNAAVKGLQLFKTALAAGQAASTAGGAAGGAASGAVGTGVGAAVALFAAKAAAAIAIGVGSFMGGLKIGRYLTGQSEDVKKSQAVEADLKARMEVEQDELKRLQIEKAMYVQRGRTEQADTWTGGLFGDNEVSAETQQKIKELDAKIASFTISNEQVGGVVGGGFGTSAMEIAKQEFLLKTQGETLKANLSYTASISEIYNKSGNTIAAIAANEKAISEILRVKVLATDQLKRKEEELIIARQKGAPPQVIAEAEKGVVEARSQVLQLTEDEAKVRTSITNSTSAQMELLNKQVSLQESQIALLDSAGMGLKAQASARQQVVQMLGQQIAMERDREGRAQAQKAELIQQMESQVGDEREKTAALILERNNEILDSQQKQVQAVQKQADITKSLREGYISAIQAMTSGAGVFQRIVLKQDQGLGTLAAMRKDGLNALTTGGIGVGRTGSARFGAGGYTEGQAGAYEQKVLAGIGVNAANSLQQNVSAMVNYTQKTSQGMSAAAASYGQGPLGSGAFAGANNTGITKFGGNVTAGARGGIAQTEMDALKRTMVEIFSKIGQEIVNETIRRLRQ